MLFQVLAAVFLGVSLVEYDGKFSSSSPVFSSQA